MARWSNSVDCWILPLLSNGFGFSYKTWLYRIKFEEDAKIPVHSNHQCSSASLIGSIDMKRVVVQLSKVAAFTSGRMSFVIDWLLVECRKLWHMKRKGRDHLTTFACPYSAARMSPVLPCLPIKTLVPATTGWYCSTWMDFKGYFC